MGGFFVVGLLMYVKGTLISQNDHHILKMVYIFVLINTDA